MGRNRPMPRRGAPAAARGHGNRGGAGAAAAANLRVAKPRISELPPTFSISPTLSGIPTSLLTSFPEFQKAQPYFSALERIMPEYGGSPTAFQKCWIGISGESLVAVHRDPESTFSAVLELTDDRRMPVFVKRIHLLDPISAMEGEYVWPDDGALPAPSDLWKGALAKVNDPMNEAYVDAVFAIIASKLVETGTSPHWCRCYGTYTARAEKYLYNITDEYDSLRVKPWWRRNQRAGLFALFKDMDGTAVETQQSHFLTDGLTDICADDFEELEGMDVGSAAKKVEEKEKDSESEDEPLTLEGETVQLTSPRVRLERMAAGSSDDDDDDDEEEIEQFAEFKNFPVQVTLLEHADGTMDELLDDENDGGDTDEMTKEARWGAWLFQVIAALTEAQYMFGFVHNDLHTNNVMWSNCDKSHIYYKVHKGTSEWLMRVPTYGKLMKIIDFGRASFHLPDPAGFFISDAFYPGNDAATQYNCEPFYDPTEGKKVEPNPSFDLCRLAVSLLESLYPDRPAAVSPVRIMTKEGAKIYSETVSPVYNMLWEWLQDDANKNVLRSPNGEERYPDFDLYRALAAEVHRAVPSRQLERPLFAAYRCAESDVPAGEKVYDLHI